MTVSRTHKEYFPLDRMVMVVAFAIGFFLSCDALAWSNMAVKGDPANNSWGLGVPMTQSGSVWRATVQKPSPTADWYFRYETSDSGWKQFGTSGSGNDTVAVPGTYTTTHSADGALYVSSAVANSYYTFATDNSDPVNAYHQVTANNPVTFSRSGEDTDSKHAVSEPNTITVTTSASDPDEDIYIRYSTNGGSSWSEVKTEGSGTTFTNDIPGQAEGTTVQYYTFSTTFTAVDTDTDLKTIRYDNSGYGNNTSYTIPTLGNCWHIPDNGEPPSTTMRAPTGTPDAGSDLYIYNGSYTNHSDQSGGTVYHREIGAGGWSTATLNYDTQNGNNKYWLAIIVADTYNPGDDIEYYIKVTHTDDDDTYIGTENGGVGYTLYGIEANAQANTFKTFYAPDTSSAIWSEDFQSYAVGTGIDHNGEQGDYPDNVTKWTLATNGCSLTTSGDYIETVSESGDVRIEVQDVDGPARWISENVDISLYTSVEFSLEVHKNNNVEANDYVDVEYQTDGGGWTLIENWNGEGSGSHTWEGDGTSDSMSVTQAVAGSSVDIRVSMNNGVGGELFQLDNIIITGTLAAPATPTGITVTDTNVTDFVVEWTEMASATNYAIDVSTSSSFQTPTGNGIRINEVAANYNTYEFVELIAPAGTALTGYKIIHYNGSGGAALFTHTIGSVTVEDDSITDENGTSLGFYVLERSGDSVVNADESVGTDIQDGDDGIVLTDADDNILDAVWWDSDDGDQPVGTMSSGDSSADNYLHIFGDAGSSESRQAPNAVRSDDGSGWTSASPTPGAINDGQTSGSIVLQAATPNYVSGYSNTLTGDDETITVSGLTHSTTYHYRLRSMGTGGTSASSATQSVTTEAPAAGGANATLSWITGGETENIAYASYRSTDITGSGNATSVLDLRIADGTSDSYTTDMTGVSFDVTGHTILRKAALYDGTTELAEVTVSGSPITFSGLTGATADDAGTKDLILYVTFQDTVTDNTQMTFTVSSVTANAAGTTFAATDGGGAASITSGDNNRIEVTATKLVISGTPTTVGISENFSATVTAKDALGNVDLDSTTSVTITQDGNSGTLTGGDATALTSGTHTFSTLQVDASGGFTLTASDGSLTDATSGTIATELNVGDLYFTGFNADGDEDLAFVVFEDVPAGTELYFRIDEWDGSAFSNNGTVEKFSWNSGGSVLSAGTVVVLSALDTTGGRSASVGTLSGDATSINLNDDGVFCYYGSDADTPTRFLAAIGNGTESGAFDTLSGTGLTDGETAMTLLGETDLAAYTSARSGFAKSTYKTMVADENNWTLEAVYDPTPAPNVPFDDTPFTFASPASLSAGDIAFVGYNSANPDQFAFIALTDIPQATEIKFTDKEWSNVTSNLTVEGTDWDATWTASAAVSAGTVVTIEDNSADVGSWSQNIDLVTSGESLLAYQGTVPAQTFMAGLNMKDWNSTNLPSGLTVGLDAIHFGIIDHGGYYLNVKTTGTVAALKTAINNEANWHTEDANVTFPSWSFTIQSSTPTLVAGDIAFIAYDLDADRFAFVAMTDIAENTEIAFTDIGWDKTDLVPDVDTDTLEEHTAVWTAPGGGLSYGDVVRVQGTNVTGGGTISGALSTFSASGEQLLAFQGTVTSPSFVAALSSYLWRTGAQTLTTAHHSHLPSTLTEGQNAVQPSTSGEKHGRYYGDRVGLRAELLPKINDSAYWQVSGTTQTWWTPWYFGETAPPTLFLFK